MTIFQCKNPTHNWYKSLMSGDYPSACSDRKILEDWWIAYHPYADSHFLEELGRDFHQRVWEMRLGVDLLKMGIKLKPNQGKGPDLHLEYQGKTVWVEAVVPEKGNGDDCVPEVKYGVACDVPEEQIRLRYTSVLWDKYKDCYQKYFKDGLIQPDDHFIVAINGFLLEHPDGYELPHIVKCVYGIGQEYWLYDEKQDKLTECGYEHKPEILKKSGNSVAQDSFLNNTYAGITGIIFSRSSILNPLSTKPIEDYLFIHNRMATNKLPIDLFKDWLHFTFHNGKLESHHPANNQPDIK